MEYYGSDNYSLEYDGCCWEFLGIVKIWDIWYIYMTNIRDMLHDELVILYYFIHIFSLNITRCNRL